MQGAVISYPVHPMVHFLSGWLMSLLSDKARKVMKIVSVEQGKQAGSLLLVFASGLKINLSLQDCTDGWTNSDLAGRLLLTACKSVLRILKEPTCQGTEGLCYPKNLVTTMENYLGAAIQEYEERNRESM